MRTLLFLAAFCVATLAAPSGALAKIVPMADLGDISGVLADRLHVPAGGDFDCSAVGEPPYAVAYWKAASSYSAGSALLKKSTMGWTIVKMSKTSLKDASVLSNLGVPAKTAQALVADLNKAGQ
jgi:hypothetical protein